MRNTVAVWAIRQVVKLPLILVKAILAGEPKAEFDDTQTVVTGWPDLASTSSTPQAVTVVD